MDFEPELDRPEPPSAVRKVGVSLVAVVVLLLLVEGASSLLLAWTDSTGERGIKEEFHCAYDPDLGWSNRANVHLADLYGANLGLTTNARGFRATEEYTDAIPAGRTRIVCLGDSFTLGYGVDDSGTYPAQLERLVPEIQAVNMGQGGYGVDQCYLWYKRDGVALEADIVILGFIAPGFDRMTESRFQNRYAKPVLVARDGKLEVTGVPVPDDWSGSASQRLGFFARRLASTELLHRLYRSLPGGGGGGQESFPGGLPYRAEAELLLADLDRICEQAEQGFALLMFPLRDRRAGRPAEVAAWLAGVAAELGIPFMDLTGEFDALPSAELELYYQPDGHLNALGNRLVAEIVLGKLKVAFPDLLR